MTSVDLVYDQCSAYLAAGMPADALDVVERPSSLVRCSRSSRQTCCWRSPGRRSRQVTAARARSAADAACRLFRSAGSRSGTGSGRSCSRSRRGPRTAGPARAGCWAVLEALVDGSSGQRLPELPQVLLLGARIGAPRALGPGRRAGRTQWLDEAAAFQDASTGPTRALGWLAAARRRELAGDVGGVLRACERGLVALDEHRATLGSQELRALSAGHGADLAELGTRTALRLR